MEQFTKDSPEYIKNGHYKVDEQEFMSVWTFKNTHNLSQKTMNPNEGKELSAKCSVKYGSKPDFGSFDFIYIYPVSELEDYYGI